MDVSGILLKLLMSVCAGRFPFGDLPPVLPLLPVESSFRGIFRGALMSEEVVPMAGVDAMRERIAAHPWPRGGVAVTRGNRGYTLYSRRTGGPVARLRPTDRQGGQRAGPVVAARDLGHAGRLRTPH